MKYKSLLRAMDYEVAGYEVQEQFADPSQELRVAGLLLVTGVTGVTGVTVVTNYRLRAVACLSAGCSVPKS
ncbi:hypothetical protein [Paenibacillus silvae]|uniref:hypothetical protein n=1 Tax=Paenibacillus silvae TaxID=1325358 RepID=UPI0011B5DC05|nr:hypothetical protein [Paenibacillus silvae]